jgi:NosR/NirI family nitrous oxide reductase transcriptional regulator
LVILCLQEVIVRRPRLHAAIRVAFLSWTVGWIGWAVGAQLSVIHVLNWIESVNVGVDWTFFMMEPLIFMLSVFVVIAALLWGRAAFCGWLCPFGALQELLNSLAVRLRVPQIELPAVLAERLIAVKYLVFFALVGLTFYSTELAFAATGIEPFKAAITFRFDAPMTAVAYATGLLAVGLFVERFYCRFICPLGAGLAILGRLRMFDWLKRRAECGNPCSRCENKCPVRAIRKDGTIDMNECFYCLDCQVVYHDQHQCPPLIKRRKRIEAATSLDAPTAIKASG